MGPTSSNTEKTKNVEEKNDDKSFINEINLKNKIEKKNSKNINKNPKLNINGKLNLQMSSDQVSLNNSLSNKANKPNKRIVDVNTEDNTNTSPKLVNILTPSCKSAIKLILQIENKKVPVQVLLDSGAEVNCISKRCADKFMQNENNSVHN